MQNYAQHKFDWDMAVAGFSCKSPFLVRLELSDTYKATLSIGGVETILGVNSVVLH